MDEKKKSSFDNNNEELERPQKLRYPRSIAFIIGNEFCERFSYYGMKAILVLYFKNVLKYDDNSATEYYHIFAMACYFTPVLGAIIADSLLGKFRTIFYISILYAIGNVVLSYAAYDMSNAISWIGLAAIALGTGGIKPCVSAFGGDQFLPGQEKQLAKFFSFFYISINAGSLLSTFITPILREDVQCFGRLDCFPLAFGVPAALMIVALALFLLGRVFTNYRIVAPSKNNVVVQVVSCVFTALGRKISSKGPKRDHWLDYADDKCDAQTLEDIKAVMRVLFLYLPLPIFWALFDQQGSRWTLQATRMDGNFFGVYRLKPDQIQVVNPLLIICMIPVFQYAVYPLLARVNLLKKPLQRIITGGILAAVSFVICAFFQLRIEADLPIQLSHNSAHITIANGLGSPISFTHTKMFEGKGQSLGPYDLITSANVPLDWIEDNNNNLIITLDNKIGNCEAKRPYTATFNNTIEEGAILYIAESICSQNIVQKYDFSDILSKPADGGANIALVFNTKNNISEYGPQFQFHNEDFTTKISLNNVTDTEDGSFGMFPYNELDIHKGGKYQLKLVLNISNQNIETVIADNLDLLQGASYIMIVYGDQNTLNSTLHQTVKENSLSMFLQIIQYTVITAGEIMFSITGLEFSYSQAPASMKSVLQAAWLLTVAFGNLIVVIVASVKIFDKQSYEFFFFAGLMVLDMIIFAIMAYFYVPYQGSKTGESDDQKTYTNGNTNKDQQNGSANDKNGITNDAFSEDTKF